MNKKSNRVLAAILTAATALLAGATANAQLLDGMPHVPPLYFTFQPPAAGTSYVDPVFGLAIKRLSNSPLAPDNANGGTLPWIMTEYASMAAFNKGGTRLVLQHGSYYGLYDGQGRYLRDLPLEIHASSEPRWSRANANVLYYVNGNRLKKHDVGTGATSLVRTFSEYSGISGHGESDIAFTGEKLVLAGDARFVFVYDIAANQKGTVLDTAGRGGWNSLYLTPDGNVLVSWYANGLGRYRGIERYDRNMAFLNQVVQEGGHMDVTRDASGAEVLVWTNANDPAPICQNGVVKVRLSTGAQTCLVSLDWALAIHVSCPDAGGTCIVGTYAPGDPNPASGWPAYTNELLRVRLDGSATERLAHHRSRPFDGYNYTPRASVSRDGSKLVFSSNYGLQEILGRADDYSDAYLMQLGGGVPPLFGHGFEAGNTGGWSAIQP